MLMIQKLMNFFSRVHEIVLDLKLTILRKRIFPLRLPSAELKFANAIVMEAALKGSIHGFLIDL